MLEAASSSEMSVHIYKIARCHIHEGNKRHILAHWIASLTSANLKTFLLWKVVLKKRKPNASNICYAIRFLFPFTFIFPLLKIVTKYTHARTKAVYILYRSISFNLHCSWYVFEIELVDGSAVCAIKYTGRYTVHRGVHSIHTAPTLTQLISGIGSEGE